MDKLKKIFTDKILEMEHSFQSQIKNIPDWKVKTYFDKSDLLDSTENLRELLYERLLKSDEVYLILKKDFTLINQSLGPINIDQLQILKVKDRELEGKGYLEAQKAKLYAFIAEIHKQLKEN